MVQFPWILIMIILHWQNWMKPENCFDQKLIRFDLMNKSTGQVTNILGAAVKDIFDWCAEKDKRLIVEDIDLTIKLASRKYGNRKGNHHMTLFAYQRIASSIENQSLNEKLPFARLIRLYQSNGKVSVHAKVWNFHSSSCGIYDWSGRSRFV